MAGIGRAMLCGRRRGRSEIQQRPVASGVWVIEQLDEQGKIWRDADGRASSLRGEDRRYERCLWMNRLDNVQVTVRPVR